ncbi:MAG: RimJ/RimL family protein N-acetyltransferase [Salibacteraceae bacterium]|jgi:RimJ/RimL family protein N-acetyltransferase
MGPFSIENAFIVEAINAMPKWHSSELRVERISKSNINDALWFNNEETLKEFERFIEIGHIGYYCYLNEVCIFRTWIFTDSNQCFVGQNFIYKLKPLEYFSAWSETASDYRGKGAFSFTLNHILNELNENHISAFIDSKNIGSIKGTKKVGFVITQKYFLFRLYRLRIQVRYYHHSKNKFNLSLRSVIH